MESRSKVIRSKDGTFIVDEGLIDTFDPESMTSDDPPPDTETSQKAVVVIDGKEYRGKIIKYSIFEDKVGGKTRVRLVLDV